MKKVLESQFSNLENWDLSFIFDINTISLFFKKYSPKLNYK